MRSAAGEFFTVRDRVGVHGVVDFWMVRGDDGRVIGRALRRRIEVSPDNATVSTRCGVFVLQAKNANSNSRLLIQIARRAQRASSSRPGIGSVFMVLLTFGWFRGKMGALSDVTAAAGSSDSGQHTAPPRCVYKGAIHRALNFCGKRSISSRVSNCVARSAASSPKRWLK